VAEGPLLRGPFNGQVDLPDERLIIEIAALQPGQPLFGVWIIIVSATQLLRL
jgi:hypothetical protein